MRIVSLTDDEHAMLAHLIALRSRHVRDGRLGPLYAKVMDAPRAEDAQTPAAATVSEQDDAPDDAPDVELDAELSDERDAQSVGGRQARDAGKVLPLRHEGALDQVAGV